MEVEKRVYLRNGTIETMIAVTDLYRGYGDWQYMSSPPLDPTSTAAAAAAAEPSQSEFHFMPTPSIIPATTDPYNANGLPSDVPDVMVDDLQQLIASRSTIWWMFCSRCETMNN
ncbi:Uncharacterized protein Fot_36490 [Forsythia ovata]|uniref:Uncharacterized protein n=1 Tax=Forsythia ovata TaxID=205694 RepID=A0ABD1SSG5_9LAMI